MMTRWLRTAGLAALIVMFGACATVGQRTDNARAAAINAKLGLAYMKQNHMALAETKLTRALEQAPNSSLAHWANALFHERLGNDKLAEKHFRKAVRLNPKDPGARNGYGAFLCRQGRVQAGLAQFQALADDPEYVTPEVALTNAGKCLLKSGDDVGAEGYFRRALEVNPRYPSALFEMASLLDRQRRYLGSRAYRQRLEAVLDAPSPKVLALCVSTERAMGNHEIADDCERQLQSRFPGAARSAEP